MFLSTLHYIFKPVGLLIRTKHGKQSLDIRYNNALSIPVNDQSVFFTRKSLSDKFPQNTEKVVAASGGKAPVVLGEQRELYMLD